MTLFAAANWRYIQGLIDGDPVSWVILAIVAAVVFPIVWWRSRRER